MKYLSKEPFSFGSNGNDNYDKNFDNIFRKNKNTDKDKKEEENGKEKGDN
jgi:hypothetical protein